MKRLENQDAYLHNQITEIPDSAKADSAPCDPWDGLPVTTSSSGVRRLSAYDVSSSYIPWKGS
ncbi:hypothetical protein GCM10009696_31260 [Kocuria himachalensis]